MDILKFKLYLFSIFVILSCTIIVEGEFKIINYSINQSDWEDMIENKGIYKLSEHGSRNKRFISLESMNMNLNQEFQPCTTPSNASGHCRHLHYCLIDEIKNNYGLFVQHFCKIGSMFVGICCPDNNDTVIEKSEKLIELPTNELSMVEGRIVFTGSTKRGCGLSTKSRTKIVGGRPADPKEWPWMAALLRERNKQFCGGVLITNRHVLTAAHCTYGLRPLEIRIRLGEYDFTKYDDSRSQDFRVIDIKNHPQYNDDTSENDISMLTLFRMVTFDDYVWPICLPNGEDDFVNKTATVTGWGSLGFGEPMSDVLMAVDFPIWSQTQCEAKLSQPILDTQICAGSFFQRKDACQGDSGGPLMYRLSTGRWLVVGIVSYGRVCGMIGQPGIYTRVNKYLPWIIESTLV